MKIAFLADYFTPEMVGGAELEDEYVLAEGIKRGHEIIQITPNMQIPREVDLYFLSNICNFNIGKVLAYISNTPYINSEHDLRLPRRPIYKKFAGEALVNIFRSPIHRDRIQELSGCKFRHFLHPLCLSPKFRDLRLKRKSNPVLYVGWVCRTKGYLNLERWLNENRDMKIDVYGKGRFSHPRIHERGWVSQNKLIKIYNTYESLIFLPDEIQACSRVVAEAFMCKVPNLICTEKTGFSSYDWTNKNYDEIRKKIICGAEHIWYMIEEAMKGDN